MAQREYTPEEIRTRTIVRAYQAMKIAQIRFETENLLGGDVEGAGRACVEAELAYQQMVFSPNEGEHLLKASRFALWAKNNPGLEAEGENMETKISRVLEIAALAAPSFNPAEGRQLAAGFQTLASSAARMEKAGVARSNIIEWVEKQLDATAGEVQLWILVSGNAG